MLSGLRWCGVLLLSAVLAAGCTTAPPAAPRNAGDPYDVRPAGVRDPAAPSSTGAAPDCGDPRASLRPASSGPAIDRIRARGFLVAGVNQNAYRVGHRDPASGELVGFEIDIVREIARALFGDPGRVRLVSVDAAGRAAALRDGDVDLVIRTMTMTCAAWQEVAFSTEYFTARQRLLVPTGSTATEIEDLDGQKVCAAAGSTSLTNISELNPRAIPVSTSDVVDCLVLLGQHQVDAVSTSDILLAALAAQDPNTEVVGRPLKEQPFGIATAQASTDLVRLVNGVLERIRADGTWRASYTRWLSADLGPAPAPPPARYRNRPDAVGRLPRGSVTSRTSSPRPQSVPARPGEVGGHCRSPSFPTRHRVNSEHGVAAEPHAERLPLRIRERRRQRGPLLGFAPHLLVRQWPYSVSCGRHSPCGVTPSRALR